MKQRTPQSTTASVFGEREAPRYLEPQTTAIGPLAVRVLLVGLTFLLATFELADYDIWWHLRTGQLIQERGTVPDQDWYSFTADNRDWLDVHWGFQVLFSWLHTRFGVPGMVIAKAVIASLAVAIALTAYKPTWSPTVQILIWLPVLFLMSSRFYIRPEILTLLFTAIFLTVLFHAEERPGWLWLLPLVQIFWANVQGLFAFGPILVGMYLVEAVLRANLTRGLWRHLLPVSLLVPAACLVSPYGIRNVLFVFELWAKVKPKENLFRKHVAELQDFPTFWSQGGFVNPYAILFVIVCGLAAVSLLLAAFKILQDRRAFWVLAAGAFGYLGVASIRNGNHFAMVVGSVATWCLGSMTESNRRPRAFGSLVTGTLVLGSAFAVASGRWYLLASPDRKIGLENRESFNSPEAMKLAGRAGMPERAAIFNFGHAGEYIYFNCPERRVFFDGRLEVYAEQQFREYIELEDAVRGENAAAAPVNWDGQMHAHNCDTIIIDGEHNLAMQSAVWAHPMWMCVHYDEVVAVFLRKSFTPPAGVREFRFQQKVFDANSPVATTPLPVPASPLTWTFLPPAEAFKDRNDFYAERTGQLGLGLMTRSTLPASMRLANAAFSLQCADRSVRRRPWSAEARRYRGIACYLAAFAIDGAAQVSAVEKPWNPDSGLLFAMSAAGFRQTLACNPNDYSANFYLQQFAKQAGFLEECELLLDRLASITASNIYRQQLREPVVKERDAVRHLLEINRGAVDPSDLSYPNLVRLAQQGVLANAVRRLDGNAANGFSKDQTERVGTWLMQLGEPERALSLYQGMKAADETTRNLQSLRIGQCQLLRGDYEAAKWEFAKLPKSYEVRFSIAWLALVTGQRQPLEQLGKQLDDQKWGGTPDQLARLKLLTDIAVENHAKEPDGGPAP